MPEAGIDLYWLPLGAGGRMVGWCGRVFEAGAARRAHRSRRDLYHSALVVRGPVGRFTIEMGPVWNISAAHRGVVLEGPVGARRLGCWRLFRYEVRCWRDGVIPDLAESVGGPQRVSSDRAQAERVLRLVRSVPALTWGRDELGAGEMWNSNSLCAWLLARSGSDLNAIEPPAGGRAPGWRAGLVLAHRQQEAPPRAAPG